MKRSIRTRLPLSSLAVAAVSLLTASGAQATGVAAWDFSQYAISGFLTTDATTFALTQTLDANYSDLDPNRMGSPADQFGTMYLNGDFGSTAAALSGDFIPNSNDLTLNNDALDDETVLIGDPSSLIILDAIEGQPNTNALGFGPDIGGIGGTVVFGADLSSVPEQGQSWSLSFAGLTQSGGTSEVGVEFSPNGLDFQTLDPFVLQSNAAVFATLQLGDDPTDQAFFRLTFADSISETFPSIDNLVISADLVSVPEAGTLLLLGSGLLGLTAIGRRRAG